MSNDIEVRTATLSQVEKAERRAMQAYERYEMSKSEQARDEYEHAWEAWIDLLQKPRP